jgi:TonB family protein
MKHGIDFYFIESLRLRRRLSMLTFSLALVGLGPFLLLQIPLVRRHVLREPTPTVRIGYEGFNRIVERIELNALEGRSAPLIDVGHVVARPMRKGGEGLTPAKSAARAGPRRPVPLRGLGEDEEDLMAAARARMANVPIVQSEDLVIESMRAPEYPEDLHARGVEGRVALMALVDSTGHVAEVSVVESTGELAFEQSASEVVRMARFRPYRIAGAAREVYAVIRYRFRIY